MKVKMLTSLSGQAFCLSPGDEMDFPQSEAVSLIEAGYAVPVAEARSERATRPAAAEKRSA